jgi:hypothetical protein
MTRHRWLASIALSLLALGGCGEGYEVKPATLNITGVTDESKSQILSLVSHFLVQEGFKDFGKDNEMIALFDRDRSMRPTVRQQQLARLKRELTFLDDPQHLRVVLVDYTNANATDLSLLRYIPSSGQFIEINIYEERPGGFSPSGSLFYERFLSILRKQLGASLVIVNSPPPTNDAEYRRITAINREAAVVGWFAALLIPLAFTGTLSVYLLGRLKLSRVVSRLIFVVINGWLVAPLPFQGGYIFVFPGPNLLAFPWTDFDYYSKVTSYARISFPCALLLCSMVSLLLFRGTPTRDTVAA